MVMDDPTLPRIKVRDLLMQAFLTGWTRSDKAVSQDEYLQSSIQVIEMLQVEPENLYAEEGLGLPALYILDIMLPGMDGLEILRRLREGRDTADIPVIMLTARSAEMDRVAGLENGADDYVVKPFGIMELQARVKAVLRRTERRGDRVLTWGDVELDPAAREVHKAGKPVELTYKEFELLKLLFSRRGVALTRDEILQAVWDYDYTGETRTVDMHVKALRQKLGAAGEAIRPVRKVGYKLSTEGSDD